MEELSMSATTASTYCQDSQAYTHHIVEGLIPLVEALQDNSGEDVADEPKSGDRDEDYSLQPESAPWCQCQLTAFELFDIT